MALVLYQPLPILKHFHTHERFFEFPGMTKQIKISQDWNTHGVAAVVWEAAIILSTFLQSISKDIQNKNILELGSGTGLCGIIAAMNGANVTFTDKDNELDICRKNIKQNLIEDYHQFKIVPLDWMTIKKKKWSETKFNYIIGADLVYIEELFPYLSNVFKFFAGSNPDLKIYLAGKIRYIERYNRFIDIIKTDFIVTDINYPTPSNIYIVSLVLR